ncbi:hypothetical protein PybrP1_001430, partial [[Pythium] brassicae (nom. inval.)]
SCPRCRRPPRVCYCADLPPAPLRALATHVLVLQHRHEQRRRAAISSVPIIAHVLVPTTVVAVDDAGVGPGSSEALDRLLFDGAAAAFERVFVLFPDAAAKTLNAELLAGIDAKTLADSRGGGGRGTEEAPPSTLLVVLDGTWTEAKKVLFHSRPHFDALAGQRRSLGRTFEFVCLDLSDAESATPLPNIYGDLRREPMEGCMATLEAVALALKALETKDSGERLYAALLAGFRGMVTRQQELVASGRQRALEQHGGVSKRDAVLQRRKRQLEQSASEPDAQDRGGADDASRSEQRRVREYVFVNTLVDFRHRKQLVQQGPSVRCTYDEARDKCQELNVGRARGQRLAMMPFDTFCQQQQQQQREEYTSPADA